MVREFRERFIRLAVSLTMAQRHAVYEKVLFCIYSKLTARPCPPSGCRDGNTRTPDLESSLATFRADIRLIQGRVIVALPVRRWPDREPFREGVLEHNLTPSSTFNADDERIKFSRTMNSGPAPDESSMESALFFFHPRRTACSL